MNMAKLTTKSSETFYGIALNSVRVDALTCSLRHGVVQEREYSWLDFCDERGPKWRIKPTAFSKKGIPSSLRLYHRNSRGRRGFHSQKQYAWGTRAGFRELISYIVKHEEYEKSGRGEVHA